MPGTAFRWKPDINLHLKVKDALTNGGIFDYADPSVTDKTRLIRVNNTKNLKAGLWKSIIPISILHEENVLESLRKIAYKPGEIPTFDLECEPVFDVLERNKTEEIKTLILLVKGDYLIQ